MRQFFWSKSDIGAKKNPRQMPGWSLIWFNDWYAVFHAVEKPVRHNLRIFLYIWRSSPGKHHILSVFLYTWRQPSANRHILAWFSQILARACRPILAFLIFYCRIPKFFRLSVCISFCSRHFFLKSFCIWHFLKGPRHVYRNQAKIWRGVNHRHILILFLPGLLPYMNLPD